MTSLVILLVLFHWDSAAIRYIQEGKLSKWKIEINSSVIIWVTACSDTFWAHHILQQCNTQNWFCYDRCLYYCSSFLLTTVLFAMCSWWHFLKIGKSQSKQKWKMGAYNKTKISKYGISILFVIWFCFAACSEHTLHIMRITNILLIG